MEERYLRITEGGVYVCVRERDRKSKKEKKGEYDREKSKSLITSWAIRLYFNRAL